jgi:signal transduction histidine kinase
MSDVPLHEPRAAMANVLAVDDTPANLVALEAALSPLRCRLVTARSGDEALTRMLEQEFALVLMDVAMPEMDGYETARWIRTTRLTQHVPIIFLTAYDQAEERVAHAYKLGAVDYLFKPLDTNILRAKVNAFLALHVRTQEVAHLQMQRALDEERARMREQTMERELEQLALADRRKNEFLAMLAHELRNPLAPIRSAIDLIRQAPEVPMSPRLLDIVDRQLFHVTRLVDDLLDVSRIAARKLELRREIVDLASVIDLAVTETQPAFEAKQHVLTLHPPPEPMAVDVDAVRLVQVIANLLTNAARYTPRGGRIDVTWECEQRMAFVRLADNGIGIDPSLLDRVFDMFVQERTRSADRSGLGVGLALAKQLVEMHGGKIHAASDGVNKGSTFSIELPVAAPSSLVARPIKVTQRQHALSAPRQLRTIIVDDNVDICELTADLLTARGHHVVTALDGHSALQLFAEHRPDVALVDLGLPGFDGFELVKMLRERHPDLPTRYLALTGHAAEADVSRSREAGFHGHLVKPVTSATLFAAVETPGLTEPGN